jgi:hypothetical protein
MNSTLLISATLPVFQVNFEEVRIKLQEGLKKYEIGVTAENLKDANGMATELNKLSAELDKLRKEKVKEVSAPIKDFEDKVKELVSMCQDSRQKILEQVKVFEDAERAKCLELLKQEAATYWEKLGVRDEFTKPQISDLAIISNLTATGSLVLKAKNEVCSRIEKIKAIQDKCDMRVLQLENASYKAGLKSPLTKVNIERFLFETDEAVYQKRLDELIQNELKRQTETEERIRKELEKPVVPAAVEAAKAQAPVIETKTQESEPKTQELPPVIDGKFTIVATFQLEAKSEEDAEFMAKDLFGIMGISASVRVQK